MTSGGARTRSGPPPDPNASRRSRDSDQWWSLPADGRPGDPPEWPLPKPLKRELQVWNALWKKPQAVAWEQLGQDFEVALYVRRFVEAESRDASTAVGTLVRQLGEALGLTIPGLARNRWRIQTPASPVVIPAPVPARRSARDRLTVVDGDGAA